MTEINHKLQWVIGMPQKRSMKKKGQDSSFYFMYNDVEFDPVLIIVSVVKGFLYPSNSKYVIKGQ